MPTPPPKMEQMTESQYKLSVLEGPWEFKVHLAQ
jgi:hypothetical protein